jgi:hypothetical protein
MCNLNTNASLKKDLVIFLMSFIVTINKGILFELLEKQQIMKRSSPPVG